MRLFGHDSRTSGGFTLAELAVTLVIVAIGLTLVLQGVNTAITSAGHTHNSRVANGLALLTLGEIRSGLYWEDMDERLFGTYAEEGYPDYSWEVAVGDDALTDLSDPESSLAYDSWREDYYDEEDEDEEQAQQPFEKVRIRVTFPKMGELSNVFVLESWIPWDQVYGPGEDEDASTDSPEDLTEGGTE